MKIIKRLVYRLGGADYSVIRHCSPKTKNRYRDLAFALMLTVALAAISGFDIAFQFNASLPVKIAVSIGWALATLSFDFFIINGGPAKKTSKKIRIVVGLANICITTSMVFVMLNQAAINTNIIKQNSGSIVTVDEKYLKDKKARYAAITKKKAEAEKYNSEVVIPEARNVRPGPKYAENKAVYDEMIKSINEETSKLDLIEQKYLTAHQTERSALEEEQSNDVFIKLSWLPTVLWKNGLVAIFLAGCFFIFFSYIELQAMALKSSMPENDEYHEFEEFRDSEMKNIRMNALKSESNSEGKKIILETAGIEKELENQEYDFMMENIDTSIVREAEIRGKSAILRKKGYTSTAGGLEENLEKFTKISSDVITLDFNIGKATSVKEHILSDEILKLTQPMEDMLASIRKDSTPENLAESIFNWITANIIYDKGHGKFFQRTARETYNDGHGICGELSVLYIAFLRTSGIDATFVEVTKDHKGEEVSHACVMVNQNGSKFLSDPAYKTFVIEHIEYNKWNDEKLAEEYCLWNK